MTDLSRNLLAAAREGMSPDAATSARVRARIAAAVAAGGTAAVTSQATTATGATGSTTGQVAALAAAPAGAPVAASTALALKLGAVLVVVGVVAGVWIVTREPAAAVAPHVAVTASVPEDEPRGAVTIASSEPEVAALASPDEPAPASPHRTAPARAHRLAAVVQGGVETRDVEGPSLSREVELIDRAMLALRRGDAHAALAAIGVFADETRGRGQMGEDAAAVEIEALCKLHRDVTAKLAAFDRRWPSSAQRERLQTACFAR